MSSTNIEKQDEYEHIDKGFVLSRLFCRKKFLLHRWLGLAYLIQFFLSWYFYFQDYDLYMKTPLVWSLPLTGILQSINASVFFAFLPKMNDPGYYSDKSVMSYFFVVENIFFAGLLLFQQLYMSDKFYPALQKIWPVENIIVFLPYILIRPYFPKTKFRDSLTNSKKNKTMENRQFFMIVTWITKIFYVWAKHFIGFFPNYLRFLNILDYQEIKDFYFLLLSAGAATTISMFLHTLKFKKYMGPKTAFILYMISYMATFWSFYLIRSVFFKEQILVLLCVGGIIVDFTYEYVSKTLQKVYKPGYFICVMMYVNYRRYNLDLFSLINNDQAQILQ